MQNKSMLVILEGTAISGEEKKRISEYEGTCSGSFGPRNRKVTMFSLLAPHPEGDIEWNVVTKFDDEESEMGPPVKPCKTRPIIDGKCYRVEGVLLQDAKLKFFIRADKVILMKGGKGLKRLAG